MNTIRTLVIQFANELSAKEIPLFRGAVIQSMEESNILFHNHTPDGFRYSYPLIQYKRIKGKAAIVFIGKGTDNINDLFSPGSLLLRIGKKDVEMRIESIYTEQVEIVCSEKENHFKLHNWLPLNSTNYELYQGMEDMVSKIELLERILVGNILSLLKGIDIHVDQQISLRIADITNQHIIHYKKVQLMAFDVDFYANVALPQYIGIGKNSSTGYGVLTIKSIVSIPYSTYPSKTRGTKP